MAFDIDIYKTNWLSKQIEQYTVDNPDAEEIPPEFFQELMTRSEEKGVAKLENFCGFSKLMDEKIALAEKEIERLNDVSKFAKKHKESVNEVIKQYAKNSKNKHFGKYEVKLRKSTLVEVKKDCIDVYHTDVKNIKNPTQEVVDFAKAQNSGGKVPEDKNVFDIKPNKKAMKNTLNEGGIVQGAKLIEKTNVTIK